MTIGISNLSVNNNAHPGTVRPPRHLVAAQAVTSADEGRQSTVITASQGAESFSMEFST